MYSLFPENPLEKKELFASLLEFETSLREVMPRCPKCQHLMSRHNAQGCKMPSSCSCQFTGTPTAWTVNQGPTTTMVRDKKTGLLNPITIQTSSPPPLLPRATRNAEFIAWQNGGPGGLGYKIP